MPSCVDLCSLTKCILREIIYRKTLLSCSAGGTKYHVIINTSHLSRLSFFFFFSLAHCTPRTFTCPSIHSFRFITPCCYNVDGEQHKNDGDGGSRCHAQYR